MDEGALFALGVFTSSFAAATLLPGGSEAVLVAASMADGWPVGWLVVVATVGNTLGGMTSYIIGRVLPDRGKLVEANRKGLERVRRHGAPALLLSWVPLVGDPLCVAAGWLRVAWPLALLYMAVGKAARYVALVWFV